MTTNAILKSSSAWRLKLFRILNLLAPEGSSLDAVFGSYDDWRKMRQRGTAIRAAKVRPAQSQIHATQTLK